MSDKMSKTEKSSRAKTEAEKRVDYFNKILQELAQAIPTSTPFNFSYNMDIRRCIQMQHELEHDFASLMETVFDASPDDDGEDPWDAYETITPIIEEFISTEPDNDDVLELWATIGRFLYFAEGDAPAPMSDLPEKLPCDVAIGAGILRAGVPTRFVLEKIKWWEDWRAEGKTATKNIMPRISITPSGVPDKLNVHILLDTLAAAARGEKLDPETCQTVESIAAEYEYKDFTPDDVLALYECGWPKELVKKSPENVTCENASNTDDSNPADDRQAALDAVDWIENLLQGIVDTEGEHNDKCRIIRAGFQHIIPTTLTAPPNRTQNDLQTMDDTQNGEAKP